MVAASRGLEKWSRADSAAASVPSCSWSSPPSSPPVPTIRPSSSRWTCTLRSCLPRDRARDASLLDQALIVGAAGPGARPQAA